MNTKCVFNHLMAFPAMLFALTAAAFAADTDFDGLDDSVETNTGVYVSPTNTGTNPNNADTDGDGVPDGLEVKEKTSPVDATKFNSFSKGLVAYVPFDYGIRDLSGNARQLTEIGQPILTGGLDGGQAIQFDGLDDAVGFSNDSDMPLYRSDWGNPPVTKIEGPVCISIWVKRSSGGARNQCIFGKRDYTSFNLVLRDGRFAGEARWPGVQPDPVIINNPGEVADENWHHVVYQWNAPVFRIYLDGSPQSELNAPNIATLASVANPWVIGAKSDLGAADTEFLKGTVDNIRLYGRVLDNAEIAALFSSERPRFQIVQGSYTWDEAKADAEARGGRLAVLDTEEKISKVDALVASAGYPAAWIGLTDELVEGEWRWIDGQPLGVNRWAPGQPDSPAEDYACIFHDPVLNTWHDVPDSLYRFPYILETVPDHFSLSLDQGIVHGVVTGAGDQLAGTTATLTAIPNPGYAFTGWTGDASGTTNPLSILMNANKTVGATFAPDLSDADGDLLTAFDEATIHGTDPTKADTDGDGLNDGYELGIGRFAVVAGSRTWAQAKSHAIAQGGTLATFATEGEWNRALFSIGESALYDIGGLWIGATDETAEGTWIWITGEPFGFADWATGQPDNLNDSDYAAVAGDLGGMFGKWYDYRGATTRDGYIFETGYSTDPTDPDSDNDGLDDGAEELAGSNPFMADTDGDGLSDPQEVNLTHTHPNSADTDGDGINDANDDEDGDSLTNLAEITQHGTNPLKADTDGDGLSDSAELSHPDSYFALVTGSFTYPQAAADAAAKRGRVASFPNRAAYTHMAMKARQSTQGYLWIGLSDTATEGVWVWSAGTTATYDEWQNGQPNGSSGENQAIMMENSRQWADAAGSFVAAGYLFERVGLDPLAADTDGDGLSDGQEVNTVHSDPTLDDTDGDGLLDGAEVNTHGSSPLKTDTDEDGLNDREEVVTYHSNPAVKDTDGDGFDDFFEVNTGFDPALASSTPDALSSIRTAVEFRFNAANGISYRIEGSTDLNEWTTIEPVVIGLGGVVTRFYSIENQPQRYFRVRRN